MRWQLQLLTLLLGAWQSLLRVAALPPSQGSPDLQETHDSLSALFQAITMHHEDVTPEAKADSQQLVHELTAGHFDRVHELLTAYVNNHWESLPPSVREIFERARRSLPGSNLRQDIIDDLDNMHKSPAQLQHSIQYLQDRQSSHSSAAGVFQRPRNTWQHGQVYKLDSGLAFRTHHDPHRSPPLRIETIDDPRTLDASSIEHVKLIKNHAGEQTAFKTKDGRTQDFSPLVQWARVAQRADQNAHAERSEADANEEYKSALHRDWHEMVRAEYVRGHAAEEARAGWTEEQHQKQLSRWEKLHNEMYKAPSLQEAKEVWAGHREAFNHAPYVKHGSLVMELSGRYMMTQRLAKLEDIATSPAYTLPLREYARREIEHRLEGKLKLHDIWLAAQNPKGKPQKIAELMRDHEKARPLSPFRGHRRLVTWKLFADTQPAKRLQGLASQKFGDKDYDTVLAMASTKARRNHPGSKPMAPVAFEDHELVDHLARLADSRYSKPQIHAKEIHLEHVFPMENIKNARHKYEQLQYDVASHRRSMAQREEHEKLDTNDNTPKPTPLALTPEETQERWEMERHREQQKIRKAGEAEAQRKAEAQQLRVDQAQERKQREEAKQEKERARKQSQNQKNSEKRKQKHQAKTAAQRQRAQAEDQTDQESRQSQQRQHKDPVRPTVSMDLTSKSGTLSQGLSDKPQSPPGIAKAKSAVLSDGKQKPGTSREHAKGVEGDDVGQSSHTAIEPLQKSVQQPGVSANSHSDLGSISSNLLPFESPEEHKAWLESERLRQLEEQMRSFQLNRPPSPPQPAVSRNYADASEGGVFHPFSYPYQTAVNDLRFPHAPQRPEVSPGKKGSETTTTSGPSKPRSFKQILLEQKMQSQMAQQQVQTIKAQGQFERQQIRAEPPRQPRQVQPPQPQQPPQTP